MSRKALVIEDDPALGRLLRMHLRDVRFQAEIVADGVEGLARVRSGDYDLVVLDVMLPRLDGLSILREIRSRPRYLPVMMLTAKSSEADRVRGLESGADDYLTKPFSVAELLARIRALFRRLEAIEAAAEGPVDAIVERGPVRIDTARRCVGIDGREVTLTAKEFDLLLHFARHPGQVFSRVQLLDRVWGYNHEGYEHTVNSHINRLRGKIERDPAKPEHILTVWGVGYKFRDT